MKPIVCILIALGALWPSQSRADHSRQSEIVRTAKDLERDADRLRKQVAGFVKNQRGYWLATVHRREDAIETLFAVHRLTGSIDAFRSLVQGRQIDHTYYSLASAYEILRHDTLALGERLRDLGRGDRRWRQRERQVPDPFRRFVRSELADSYRRLAGRVERLAYLSRIERLPYVPPVLPIEITELRCYERKEYTYRMNFCIEGEDLERTRARVAFVKRLDPSLDPWQRDVTRAELESSRRLGGGREEQCYFLRQIGKDIRRRQRDNVYLIVERGRSKVVEACWPEDALELDF